MADDKLNLPYPCYFLYGEGGGLVTNMINGNQCLCLFTSIKAVRKFRHETDDYMHGNDRGAPKIPVDEVKNRAGLLDRLENAEARLAADGILHISLDPVPGRPTSYGLIRDFIQSI
jgi:hypothetical protein